MKTKLGCFLFTIALFLHGGIWANFANEPKPDDTQPKKISKQDLQFFESKIRPVLNDRCYSCHSIQANVAEGGLRVDTADALLRGGSGGPAILPGDPKSSLLIKAIEYQHSEYAMPPEEAGGKLSDAQIRDFVKWVRSGAPDPRVEEEHERPSSEVNADAKTWWAFQPIKHQKAPTSSPIWAWNDIDRFVAASQTAAGIKPVEDASPEALLRRLYFDLIGLPPPPEKQIEFLAALNSGLSRQACIEKVVDELLASEQFGAHWGRHWLDVARYAESTGRESNLPYNNAWRYRDFVIDSFNRDMPFDRFLISQIAGDQIAAADESEHWRNVIATGFLAIGSKGLNEKNPKQFLVDQADEQIDAVFQASMALTVACARCHDHKFDPISQAEYTAVAGIFLSTETHFGAGGGPNNRNGTPAIDLPKSMRLQTALEPMNKDEFNKARKELAKIRSEIEEGTREQVAMKKDRRKGDETAKVDPKEATKQQKLRRLAIQAAELDLKLEAYDEQGNPKVQTLGVMDKPTIEPQTEEARKKLVRYLGMERRSAFPKIDNSPLLARGDIDMPGKKVARGVPHLFADQVKYAVPPNKSGRVELANWIASDSNPMTSRVAVNRVWYWMIGQGIVSSVDNFGVTGEKPSHPELLDFLAIEFQKNNWSIKKLIREIATSRTYQLSSIETPLETQSNREKDPENRLCWKAKSRRLQAEEIRDAILCATGTLDTRPQLGTTLAKMNLQRIDRVPNKKRAKGEVLNDDVCRSVYLSLPRAAAPEMLELFDLPDANAVQGVRETTNVPSQSLFLLNNQSMATQAGLVAKAVLKKFPGRPNDKFEERLEFVYSLTLCRKPTLEEQRFARELLIRSEASDSAWVSIARGLFATAEFRYLD